MDYKDLAGKILDYAPLVGGALGGPAGAAVGGAVKVLAGLFGVKSENPTADEIHTAMTADPEMALKLKQADYQFTLEMRRIDKEEYMAALGDVAGARTRQIEHEKATGKTDFNLYILAWVIVAGFFLIIYALMSHNVPEDAQPVLFLLLGTLAAGFGSVMQFFFGSSKSSRSKDQVIANSLPMEEFVKYANGKRKVDM